jgi:hypothetical protein
LSNWPGVSSRLDEQLTELVLPLHEVRGYKFVSAGRPLALGLFRSVALVVCLMRKNVTQDFAGALFLPTWDWRHVPDRYSAKAGFAGMNPDDPELRPGPTRPPTR